MLDIAHIAVFNNHFVPLLPNPLTDSPIVEKNERIQQENNPSANISAILAQQGLFTKSVSAATVLSPNEDASEENRVKYIMDC